MWSVWSPSIIKPEPQRQLVSYIDDVRMDALVSPVFKLSDLTSLYTTRLEQLGTVLTGRVHSTKLNDRIMTYFSDMEEHKRGQDILLAFNQSFVILFGGPYIEMAALKTLGDLLDVSGWTGVLVLAGVATTGTADSFLKAAHVTHTRRAHQITASSLYLLLQESYNQYTSVLDEGQDVTGRMVCWAGWRTSTVSVHHFAAGTTSFHLREISARRKPPPVHRCSEQTCPLVLRIGKYTLCQMDPSSPARHVYTGN